MSIPSPNVTQLLQLAKDGDVRATDRLLPLVYDELRRLARSQLSHEVGGAAAQTLQPTALVHEAYLRLVGPEGASDGSWNSRGHFFGAAALAMRRILVERARQRNALKRGGDRDRVELDSIIGGEPIAAEPETDTILAIDELLEKLTAYDPGKAQIVMLRFFVGLTLEQIAAATGSTHANVKSDWMFARSWMHRELKRETKGEGADES